MSSNESPAAPPKKRRSRMPRFGQVAALLSVLGLAVLCFVAGAAFMYAGGPGAKPLAEAFQGARTWFKANPALKGVPGGFQAPRLEIDKPAACQGFTLCTTTEGAEARLHDTAGKVVHRWKMPAGLAWEAEAGTLARAADEPMHWERCWLFPNGDLLALCCGGSDVPYGFGVAKLDKDSKLLWRKSGSFHHDIEADEEGRVYLFEQSQQAKRSPELDPLLGNSRDEEMVVLSADGQVEQRFSLLEAFVGTPYLATLLSGNAVGIDAASMPMPMPMPMPPGPPGPAGHLPGGQFPPVPPSAGVAPGDVLHANSLRVLRKSMAGRFPLFKAGQVLVSLRTPSLLAVLDIPKKTVVWAAKGPWHFQHDAQFLDNGRILLFDNLGSAVGTRVLEYDPATQAIPWSYGGTSQTAFKAEFRGRCQRLPNGDTRAIDPMRRVFDVSLAKEIVWQMGYGEDQRHETRNITGATFFAPDSLTFLKRSRE